MLVVIVLARIIRRMVLQLKTTDENFIVSNINRRYLKLSDSIRSPS